jgi:hypothetical protein
MRRSKRVAGMTGFLLVAVAGTVYAQVQHCAYSGGWYCTNTGYICMPMPGWECVAVGPCPSQT